MTPTYSPTKGFSSSINSSPIKRRKSIELPMNFWVTTSCPMIAPTQKNNDSPRKRRPSIVLPLTTTSVPDVYPRNPTSPRKRRFSTISPPLPDLGTPTSPCKQRLSDVTLEVKNQHDSSSSSFPHTQKLSIIPPSTNKPPPKVCAEISQRIRSTFHYPDFDFSQHVQNRSYVVRTQYFKESECVTMLDTGVDDLLQRMFEKLRPQANTSINIDIMASPRKGLGMFSRKQISNQEAFFVEYPTVITPYVIGLSISLSALYADIFRRLSGSVFGEVMDLSSSSLVSGETKDIHEAIMRINALAIELPVPGGEFSELSTHKAIFLQTSRCNHSCKPNARWDWDYKRFSLVLTAIQPIKEGEEITISYIAPSLTSKERQDILSNYYGFQCLCPLCVPPQDNIQQSDLARSSPISTRTKISPESVFSSSLLPSFEKWCLDPTFPDDILINEHIRALQSIKREGLQISGDYPARDKGKHLDALAMCYGALEDVDNFRVWMGRVSVVRLRDKPEQKLVFDKWLSNPTSFPVWGWRKAFCGEGDGKDSDSGLSACMSMGMFEHI